MCTLLSYVRGQVKWIGRLGPLHRPFKNIEESRKLFGSLMVSFSKYPSQCLTVIVKSFSISPYKVVALCQSISCVCDLIVLGQAPSQLMVGPGATQDFSFSSLPNVVCSNRLQKDI